jgi:tetratricopeptide (TPR) repeat protein
MLDIIMFRKIADIYYLKDDLDQAIWYNKRGNMLNPRDWTWPYAIALLYQERGDKNGSLEYAEKALDLSPENEQVKELAKNLQKDF